VNHYHDHVFELGIVLKTKIKITMMITIHD
jgi:hypothetical protein